MGTEFSFWRFGGTSVLLLSLPPRSIKSDSMAVLVLQLGPTEVLLGGGTGEICWWWWSSLLLVLLLLVV